MAIWPRRRTREDPGPSPIEQQVLDDLAAPDADPPALIDAALASAATTAKRARRRADQVVIGFTIGAELDALGNDLERFSRTGDDHADLLAARRLDAHARHLLNEAAAQQGRNATRTVTGAAGIIVGTNRPNS